MKELIGFFLPFYVLFKYYISETICMLNQSLKCDGNHLEEELKRLQQEDNLYNQVGFQYGDNTDGNGVQHGPNCEENTSNSAEEPDQAFELPSDFEVPASTQLVCI